MKRIPSDEAVLKMIDNLDQVSADEMECEMLEFKGWDGGKKSLNN